MDAHLSLASTILLTPRRAALVDGEDNVLEVLVRVQLPEPPEGHAGQRPPYALALVLDRSGSMEGKPLAEAARCASHVLRQLRPTDLVSLVQFDNRVQRLWPAHPVGDGVAQRALLQALTAGGSTDLHGGWREGVATLEGVDGVGLKRVILLSDGCANQGETDTDAIVAACREWAAQGITTSTYGLGKGFNEDLMVAMGQAGQGSQYYGDSAEDLMEPFEQELGLLHNLALKNVHLSITAPDGVGMELLNGFEHEARGWRLPDLAWGAEGWAVVRLTVPKTSLPALGQSLVALRVRVTGTTLGDEEVAMEQVGLGMPVLTAPQAHNLCEDELVLRRLAELQAAQALRQMRQAASRDNWEQVHQLLQQARATFAGNPWVASMLEVMSQLSLAGESAKVLKEMSYGSAKLERRLAARNEHMAFSVHEEAAGVPAFLQRKPQQGKKNS